MDFLFPPWMRSSQPQWSHVSNTAASSSSFTGATRSLGRTGDHMKVELTIAAASDGRYQGNPERSALRAMLGKMQGQANRVYYFDPSYAARGSFPDGELVPNSSFGSAAAGWSAFNSATVAALDRILRAKRSATGATSGVANTAAFAGVVNGAAYVARTFVSAILNTGGSQIIRVEGVAGATTSGTSLAGVGYRALAVPSTGTTGLVRVYDSATAGVTIGDFFDVNWISFARCALINGASQAGPTIKIKSLPVSTNGLLLTGDMIQIGNELLMLAAQLDSDSGGNGYLLLTRPIRTTPNDGDPVIITNPMGRFVLTSNTNGWTDTPGIFSDFDITLEESLDA